MGNIEALIKNTAISAGFPPNFADLMIAWAKHETGNFTSNFFRSYNNLFGYSYVAGAKWQLPTPGSIADNNQPIAEYADPYNSVMENIDWVKRRQKEGKFPMDLTTVTTPDQLAQLLKASGYYGDTLANYAAGLRRWFSSNSGTVAVSGLFIIAGLAAWMILAKK